MFRVEITIDTDVLKLVLQELQIDHRPPTITANWQDVKKHKGAKWFNGEEFAHYIPAENHVVLQTLPPSYARLPLFQLQPRIRETLLHELRHAHQHETWPETRRARMYDGPYWLRDMEIDARGWAYKAAHQDRYRKLVAVERQPIGAGMRLP